MDGFGQKGEIFQAKLLMILYDAVMPKLPLQISLSCFEECQTFLGISS